MKFVQAPQINTTHTSPVVQSKKEDEQPSSDGVSETLVTPLTPDDLEKEFGAKEGEVVTHADHPQSAGDDEPVSDEKPAPAEKNRVVVTDASLLAAMSKLFRAAMIYPGFTDAAKVGDAVGRMSKASIAVYEQLKQVDMDIPLSFCNGVVADEWTSALFRNDKAAPELQVDAIVHAFTSVKPLVSGENVAQISYGVNAAMITAVASMALHLESYAQFVYVATAQRLDVDTSLIYKELADQINLSITSLTGITSLSDEECQTSLYLEIPDLFRVVWSTWRTCIYDAIKLMNTPAEAYQYLTSDLYTQGFPLKQVKSDIHDLLRKIVDSVLHIKKIREAK